MKTSNIKLLLIVAFVGILSSCTKDFDNINEAADNQIFNTKSGLIAVTEGLNQHFTATTLIRAVEVPGLSTREFGNIGGYLTPMELVSGGLLIPNDNAGTVDLWANLLKDKGVAESMLANVDAVEMPDGTKSGIKAYAKFFKAITLGYLIQNFEKAPINNQSDGQAEFSDKATVLAECINLLQSAKSDVAANPISTEFQLAIPGLNLPNMINAFLARYNLYAGNYDAALTAANSVDLASKSEWKYDGAVNRNPVWNFAVNSAPDTKPQDNFGLTGIYVPEAGDGRIAFYLIPSSIVETSYGLHGVEDAKGFFEAANNSLPVYLPGEMLLIKAEAYAMKNDLVNAVAQINLVRQKTNDVFGVNAGLGAWTGNAANKTDVLNEIYKNRCIELFMSGLRLEDSRRIHSSFTPSNAVDFYSERNRNYYPYPYNERANNKNCPADPSI